MGADVAKKTHCDVIVIDARLQPHPANNLADGIRVTTCIMWRQLSPWRPCSRRAGSPALYSRQRRGSQLEWLTARRCRHHLETCVWVQLKSKHGWQRHTEVNMNLYFKEINIYCICVSMQTIAVSHMHYADSRCTLSCTYVCSFLCNYEQPVCHNYAILFETLPMSAVLCFL